MDVRRVGFIAVVCGLKSEAAAVRAASSSPAIRIAVSGASAQRAEAQAAAFAKEGARAILSIGVSGALAPTFNPGDLLFGDLVRTRSGEAFDADKGLLTAMQMEPLAAPGQRAILFGSDEIVATASDKRRLFEKTGAVAVDMESHGAARSARAAGVPFAAIRAVADPAQRALPPAALNAVAPDGSTRTLAVLLECAKAPGQVPALLQLGADSSAALRTLRRDLGGLFRRLLLSLDL